MSICTVTCNWVLYTGDQQMRLVVSSKGQWNTTVTTDHNLVRKVTWNLTLSLPSYQGGRHVIRMRHTKRHDMPTMKMRTKILRSKKKKKKNLVVLLFLFFSPFTSLLSISLLLSLFLPLYPSAFYVLPPFSLSFSYLSLFWKYIYILKNNVILWPC